MLIDLSHLELKYSRIKKSNSKESNYFHYLSRKKAQKEVLFKKKIERETFYSIET